MTSSAQAESDQQYDCFKRPSHLEKLSPDGMARPVHDEDCLCTVCENELARKELW